MAALMLFAGLGRSTDAAAQVDYRGRPLADVLRDLRQTGLDLIFSSAVVGDDLVVSVDPSARDLRGVLRQILAPLDLQATDGPGSSILILPVESAADSGDAPLASTKNDRPVALFSTEVVVTPGRHAVLREEQSASRTIDRTDAFLVPAVGGDISRVVELLPGVAGADHSAAFNVRGSLAQDTSMILDGLELYDPFHLQSLQSPFSLVDNQLVDRVEFFGGGFTADYGDRHGAFLEVSTRSPDNRAQSAVELGTLNSRASSSGPLFRGAGSWLLSVRQWYPEALLDTLEPGDGERLRPSFGDAYAKLTWSSSPRTLVFAHALVAYDRVSFQERDEENNESVDASADSRYLWFRVLRSWSDRLGTETVASVGRIHRARAGVAVPDSGSFVVDDERRVDFLGLTQDLEWRVSSSHLLKAGLYARQLRAQYRYSSGEPDDPGSANDIALDPDGVSGGLYVAHRFRVSPSLATELGLRWDRQSYTDDNQLSPRFNLLCRAGERTQLRLAFGRFQQSQRIHELRIEDGETTFLPAEVSEQAELTFQHRFGDAVRLRFDGYYRRLSKLRPRYENLFEPIELFPETAADRVAIAPEASRLRGVELMLGETGSRPFTWWVSYVLSSADDRIDGESVPRSWDQTHAGKFLIGYRWQDRWFVSLSGVARSGWPTTPASASITTLPDGSIEIEPLLGQRNSSRLPTYRRFDLRASRTFSLSRGRLSLTLDVINLTDRRNACCVDEFRFEPRADGSVEGRTAHDHWLGTTPSFSALWQF